MFPLQSVLDKYSFRSDANGIFKIPIEIQSDSINVLFKLGEVQNNRKTNEVEVKVNKKLDLTILDYQSPEVSKYGIELLNNATSKKSPDQDKTTVYKGFVA